jgi:hypothetical protein
MPKIKLKTKIVTHEYVLQEERSLPPEEQTVFVVRDLSNSEVPNVQDETFKLGETGRIEGIRPQHVMLETLVRRLVDIRNLQNAEDGSKIAFPSDRDEVLAILNSLESSDFNELLAALGTVRGVNKPPKDLES